MKRITVFCGSSLGSDQGYQEIAFSLGQTLASSGIGLIYGGAKIGLMGMVADGALQNNGEVIGIIPKFLSAKEVIHENLSELILVDSMHERKMKMNEMTNGFIALPGGFGTFEELFEILTWAQLGLHQKPIGVLNVDGFYDDLFEMADKMVAKGFLQEIHQQILLKSSNITDLLTEMHNYKAPAIPTWIKTEHL